MSRRAEGVLEFDKLRELLRLRTTCAPGKRLINALETSTNREALERAFALILEAREWLRLGRELGFAALANPEEWMARLEAPGTVLEAKEFLDAGSLLETSGWLKQQFREDADKFPLLAARCATLVDFRDLQAAIRRCVLPNGEISDDASSALRRIRAKHPADARFDSENTAADIEVAASGKQRGLRDAAQRPVCDSGAVGAAKKCSGRGARRKRHGANGVRGAV